MYAVRECTALHPDEELTIYERAVLSQDPRTGDQCCSIEDGWVKHRGARCEHNLATMVCFRGTQAPTLKPHANGKEGRKHRRFSAVHAERLKYPCRETSGTGKHIIY